MDSSSDVVGNFASLSIFGRLKIDRSDLQTVSQCDDGLICLSLPFDIFEHGHQTNLIGAVITCFPSTSAIS
jgi:hypothetical protein